MKKKKKKLADIDILSVRLHGEHVGTLARFAEERIQFAFSDSYVEALNRPVLSLSLKDIHGNLITELKQTRVKLAPFFSNLLPEGPLREYLAKRANINPEREFFLLAALGTDLSGAVQVGEDGEFVGPAEDIATATSSASSSHALRFSLAGVQLKFSAVRTASGGLTIPVTGSDGDWIAKLPSTKYNHVPENEFSMMELARRSGINVPEVRLVPTANVSGLPDGVHSVGPNVFGVRRFDRSGDGRVHVEDFAQIFGLYPKDKYGKASYRNILDVLVQETPDEDVYEFVRRLAFSILIGNADMHAKNWSIVFPDKRQARLAPAYDFVSTIAYLPDDKLALNLAGTKRFNEVDRPRLESFAEKSHLPKNAVLEVVSKTVRRFQQEWKNSADLPMAPSVRKAIEEHTSSLPIMRL